MTHAGKVSLLILPPNYAVLCALTPKLLTPREALCARVRTPAPCCPLSLVLSALGTR